MVASQPVGSSPRILIADDQRDVLEALKLPLKPDGYQSVLSRQIAEAHGGTLTLENRDAGRGTRATVRIPV